MVTLPYIQDAIAELLKAPQSKEVKMAIHHLNNGITAAQAVSHNFANAGEKTTVEDMRPVRSVGGQGEELDGGDHVDRTYDKLMTVKHGHEMEETKL